MTKEDFKLINAGELINNIIEVYCKRNRLYFEDLTKSEKNKEHNCTYTLVVKRLKKAGVPLRSMNEHRKLVGDKLRGRRDPNSTKGNRKNYLAIAKLHKKWICELCGVTNTNNNFDLVVHHKDRDNKNNVVSNLQVLCQSCHSRVHITQSKIWEKSNAK